MDSWSSDPRFQGQPHVNPDGTGSGLTDISRIDLIGGVAFVNAQDGGTRKRNSVRA